MVFVISGVCLCVGHSGVYVCVFVCVGGGSAVSAQAHSGAAGHPAVLPGCPVAVAEPWNAAAHNGRAALRRTLRPDNHIKGPPTSVEAQEKAPISRL